ncbi:MAG: AsmA-like C-terminal region-containing protein, partial [Thermodesulfobacteriota bacterium]
SQPPAPAPAHLLLAFRDVEPAALAQATSALVPEAGSVADALAAAAAALDVPLEGSLTLLLAGTDVRRAEIDVTGAAGVVELPAPWSRHARIERLSFGGSYDVASATATLRQLEVDLGTPVLRVSGDWTDAASGGAVTADATVIQLPVDELASWWPADAASDARTWVTGNITAGKVSDARVALHGELALGDAPSFTLRSLEGRLSYDGLAVRYVDTMPEATGVTGTATFSPDAWSFRVAKAAVAGVAVPGAKVDIAGTASGAPRIVIDAQARGSLRDALALVDHEPLGYARAIGIAPRDASGSVAGRVQLAFPLAGAPLPHDLGAAVDAQLRGVALPRVVGDWPLRDGNLQLSVAKEELTVTGTGALAGVSCQVEWHERLGQVAGVTRTIDVRSDVDAEGRAALGYDLRPWVTGPMAVTAHVEQRGDGQGVARLTSDLRETTLAVPELRLDKPAGAPGTAQATLVLARGAIVAVRSSRLEAAGASATGTAAFTGDRLARLQLDGELPAAVKGGERPDFSLTLDPAPAGNRFRLTSEDASTLLRVLLPEARTTGGKLLFTGDVVELAHGWKLDGQLAVRSFTLTESPTLARLLTLASLSGIVDVLRDRGIAFDSLTSGIAYDAGAVTFTDGVVTGPSLRLVMDGTIDGPRDNVAMNGTLVPPIYGLNELPGKIPIIGGLFRGQEGEGLIAIDFTVRGPVKDPSVSVKPLNSLAPGVLRKLVRKVPG